ncbi:hypothetical protein MWU77_23620, partial [Rhodococcus sp. F64268]|nr:hypothetical protein [Rhodococcus sp. F64268]
MRTTCTTRAVLAVAAAVIVTVAGCSTEIDGTALVENTSAVTPVDLESLDTGEYRTEPRDYAAEGLLAGDYGPAVEGQRLAEYVIHPHAIDPALTT